MAEVPDPGDVERVASALVRVGQQPGTPADVRAPTVYEARFLATAALAAMDTRGTK